MIAHREKGAILPLLLRRIVERFNELDFQLSRSPSPIAPILVGVTGAYGSTYALDYRDRLVNQAVQRNPASLSARGATICRQRCSISLVIWSSGPPAERSRNRSCRTDRISRVDWHRICPPNHSSRLIDIRSAVYYLLTLALQLIPYSLAIGAGVNTGVALFRPKPYYQGDKWFNIIPKETLRDMGWIYTMVIPLFLVASLWEFLSPLNT
jgi:hypothetical protein